MVYYEDGKLTVRDMESTDARIFTDELTAQGWPIIVDFNVLKKYQRRGIGNRLMDAAEQIAGRYADTVCLGVGLCESYGAAQRIYVKRGYIPDGSGVWYQGRQCVQYETVCTVDDDLILFFSKALRG